MRITILTIGSRGDVQPYIALGRGLQQAGHTVTLATHAVFREFAVQFGLDFAPVEGNPREMLETLEGRGWLDSDQNPAQFVRYFVELAQPRLRQALDDSWRACQGSELIIYSLLGNTGFHMAEKLGVPGVMATLQPITPTHAFRSLGVPPNWMQLGDWANWLSHKVAEQVLWQPFRGIVNAWRQDHGLRALPLAGPFGAIYAADAPVLNGYSPTVLPMPADWPPQVHVTGYWFLEQQAWEPPPELQAFLMDGPPPLYIGFGSMTDADPAGLLETVLAALARTGQRAVLLGGWAGLGRGKLPARVFAVQSVPHDWLFPRVTAVIHHGGAGTTAAGLRAGVPSVLVPYFADQHFWGQRVWRMGVGPQPVPRKELTVTRLTAAINAAVHNLTLRRRAAEIGRQIRAERGVETAVAILQSFLQHQRT